jgi:hypothetical protein
MPLILTIMLVMYLILSLILTGIMRLAELGAARWAGRPPRPVRLRRFVRPGAGLAGAGAGAVGAGGGAP